MEKIIEDTYLFESSDYYKMKDPFLFYDIAELGWCRYLSAHINYLTKNGKKVAVCTNKSRYVLYRDFATEILPIPESFSEKYGYMLSASMYLHDPIKNIDITDHNILSLPFKEAYPEYNVITNYSKFEHERIFEPYHHSKEAESFCENFRKCIVVFPRHRISRFSIRNISSYKWVEFIEILCKEFPELDIISIGGKEETLNIDLSIKNYYNLIFNDNNLEILIALCNMKKVVTAFGTQSGIMHIATLCGAPSFIIGHDIGIQSMGLFSENWFGTEIYFWHTRETPKGYDLTGFDINNLIYFIKSNI